jgi:hypothetical protein
MKNVIAWLSIAFATVTLGGCSLYPWLNNRAPTATSRLVEKWPVEAYIRSGKRPIEEIERAKRRNSDAEVVWASPTDLSQEELAEVERLAEAGDEI